MEIDFRRGILSMWKMSLGLIFLAASASCEIIANHRVFNVGTGNSLSLLDLLEAIATEMGHKIQPEFYPPRAGDIRHSWADGNLVKNQLDFTPEAEIRIGIKSILPPNQY